MTGGFWVTRDCKLRSCRGLASKIPECRIPERGEFSTNTNTVRALEKKGYLQRTGEFPRNGATRANWSLNT